MDDATPDGPDASSTASPALPGSWKDDERAGPGEQHRRRRRLVLIAGIVAAVLLGAGALVLVLQSDPLEPEDRAWDDEAWGGRPAGLGEVDQIAAEVVPSAAPGVYAWRDFDGWHVWVVGGERVGAVTVTIRSEGDPLANARLSAPGVGSVEVDGEEATLEVPADAELTGIDFEPGFFATGLRVDVQTPDGPIDPALIQLGSGSSTTEVPFRIDKPLVD